MKQGRKAGREVGWHRQADRADRQVGRQTGRQTDRQTDRQADRQADRQGGTGSAEGEFLANMSVLGIYGSQHELRSQTRFGPEVKEIYARKGQIPEIPKKKFLAKKTECTPNSSKNNINIQNVQCLYAETNSIHAHAHPHTNTPATRKVCELCEQNILFIGLQ